MEDNVKRIPIFILIVTMLILVLTLVSCGDKSSTNNQSEGETITVTFDSNGGSEVKSQSVVKGNNVEEPDNPQKDGYTFDGWYVNDEKWFFSGYVASQNLTLTAKWIPTEYTITYIGASSYKTTYTIEEGFDLSYPSSLPRFYSFLYWSLDEDFTQPISKIEKGTFGDITIYAKTYYDPFTYNRLDNGCYMISECQDKNATDLVIPSQKNGSAVVSIGNRAFYGCTNLANIEIPNSIISVSGSAFESCTNLNYNEYNNAYYLGNEENKHLVLTKLISKDITNYEMPNDTKVILPFVFSGCTSLATVKMSNNITSIGYQAFDSCSSLSSIEIPNSTIEIGSYAFSNCCSLENITIGNSITLIYDDAFSGCINIKTVDFIGNIETWCGITFSNRASNPLCYGAKININGNSITTLQIPNTITKINNYAFYGWSDLTKAIIPNSVTSIGGDAFCGCTSLEEITVPFIGLSARSNKTHLGYIFGAFDYKDSKKYVPETLKTVIVTGGDKIDSYAFYECSSLTEIQISNSVTEIGHGAFYECSSLVNFDIPSTVISIGEQPFYACSSLTNINVDENNPNYISIEGILYDKDLTSLICYSARKKDSSFSVPSGINSIKSGAFYACTNLINVEIPNSVTSIESSAFYGCSSLVAIVIPNSVTSIGADILEGCTSLSKISLPFIGGGLNINHFGYIFGATSYQYNKEYVPATLKQVIITGKRDIRYDAFSGCDSIEDITIENGVSKIYEKAFYNCSSLARIVIPNSVITIEERAFQGCSKLTIYCEASKKPSGWELLWNSTNCPVEWGYKEN